jgi:hypothetical protein
MSDTITIHNGGEAPHAAKKIDTAVAGADQGSLMQQNGGQAPGPGAGDQQITPTNIQVEAITGGDAGGEAPLGGLVHGP